MTPPTLTREQVRKMIPPGVTDSDTLNIYSVACNILPAEDDTAYTPGHLAALGVKPRTIIWAFLRPDILGDAFGDVVCRLAETVLAEFEAARLGNTRPRAAIEAARKCFADPTTDNKLVATAAADAAAAAGGPWNAPPEEWAPWRARAPRPPRPPRPGARAAEWAARSASAVGDAKAAFAAIAAAGLALDAGCSETEIIAIIEEEGR